MPPDEAPAEPTLACVIGIPAVVLTTAKASFAPGRRAVSASFDMFLPSKRLAIEHSRAAGADFAVFGQQVATKGFARVLGPY
jgi:hypothetical protein